MFKEAEARVFRLKDGEWSLWNTDRNGTVTEKITDLILVQEAELHSSFVALRASKHPSRDGKGVSKYLGIEFYLGETLFWTMYHGIEQSRVRGKGEGGGTLQVTKYKKIPEAQQKG